MPLLNARPADVDIVVFFNPCSGSYIRSLALKNAFRVQRLRQYFQLGRGDDTLETATTTFTFDDVHRSHADAYAAMHAWGYQCGVVAVGPFEAVQGYELGEIDAHPQPVMGDNSFSLAAERAILTTRRVRGAKLGASSNLCSFGRWHDPLENETGQWQMGDWQVTPAGGEAPFQTEMSLLVSEQTSLALPDIYLPAAGSTVEVSAPTTYGPAPTISLRAERHTGELLEEVTGPGPLTLTLPPRTFKLHLLVTAAAGEPTALEEPTLRVVDLSATSEVSLRRVAACMAYGVESPNTAPFWSPECGAAQDVEIILEANDAPVWESVDDVINLQFGDNTAPFLEADPAIRLVAPLETPQGAAPIVYAPPSYALAGTTVVVDYVALDENGDPITNIDITGAATSPLAQQVYYNAGTAEAPTWVRDDSYQTPSPHRRLRVTWDAAVAGTDRFTVSATDAFGSTGSAPTSLIIS